MQSFYGYRESIRLLYSTVAISISTYLLRCHTVDSIAITYFCPRSNSVNSKEIGKIVGLCRSWVGGNGEVSSIMDDPATRVERLKRRVPIIQIFY